MKEAPEKTPTAFMCLLGALALSLVKLVVTINDTVVLAALFVGIGLLSLGFFVFLISSLRHHEQYFWSMPGTYLMAVAVFGGLALILLASNMNNTADQHIFTAIFYATEVLFVGGAIWSNVRRTTLGLGLLLIPLQAMTSVLIVYGLFAAHSILSRFIPAEEPHSHPYGNN